MPQSLFITVFQVSDVTGSGRDRRVVCTICTTYSITGEWAVVSSFDTASLGKNTEESGHASHSGFLDSFH